MYLYMPIQVLKYGYYTYKFSQCAGINGEKHLNIYKHMVILPEYHI